MYISIGFSIFLGVAEYIVCISVSTRIALSQSVYDAGAGISFLKTTPPLVHAVINNAQKQNDIIIFCGDFNRDLSEFMQDENQNIVFSNKHQTITLYSPWINAQEKGSYFYNNQWTKIDHFFFSNTFELKDFYVYKEFTTKEDGSPFKFNLYNGEGYSDHLPITATICY